MTREEIEQLNEVEPYCFETDREERWYRVGLQEGLSIADEKKLQTMNKGIKHSKEFFESLVELMGIDKIKIEM